MSPELKNIFDNHDIVLLTETWTDKYADLTVHNFEHFVLHRTEIKSKSKRSSGGIIVYMKNKFVSRDTQVFQSQDDILCVKIEAHLLGLEYDLFLCLCYVVPENSSRQAMLDSHTYQRLLDFIVSLDSKYENVFHLTVCGDLNSRTSDLPDYVTDDNFSNFDVLPDDYIIDTEILRYSQDKRHVNNNGQMLLDHCKQTGLRIVNWRFSCDQGIGRKTFISSSGSSLVDYVLVTQNLLSNIDYFQVHDPN